MPARNKFRIRKKPEKPARKVARRKFNIPNYYYGGENEKTLDDVVCWASQYTEDFKQVRFEVDYTGCYYEGDQPEVMVCVDTPEADEEYERSCSYYYRKKKEYDQWYADNEAQIKKEMKLREKEAEEEAKAQAARNKQKTKKKIAKMEKQIETLKKYV